MSFFSSISNKFGSLFHPSQTQQINTDVALGNKIKPAGGFMQHYKELQDIDGSFKKGGPVKKTGIYKLHKGEYVLNPRLVALIKSGEGNDLKGYKQTYKTVPKLKYDREKSINYRKRTGFFRTKIDSQGHTAGYNWAKEQGIPYNDRKRKYGLNSPSFDEGVYEYKQNLRQEALKNKRTKK